jgi:hypothetical protein
MPGIGGVPRMPVHRFKTAKALGPDVPASLPAIADEVVEEQRPLVRRH